MPKSIQEAITQEREIGNTLWRDAVASETKNVRIVFEVFEGERIALPPKFTEDKCHMISDVKMGENFRRKARMVAGTHTTDVPTVLTYSSVVSRDSFRIDFTIAALNDLKVLSCDIQNAFLSAKYCEKTWTRAGPKFK